MLLIPSLWIFLTFFSLPVFLHSHNDTVTRLKWIQTKLNEFNDQYQRLPLHLSELKTYIRAQGDEFVPYDTWGSRLLYVPLSEKWYFIKSFGSDRMENTLTHSLDPSILKMPPLPKRPPIHLAGHKSALNLFPAPILMGLQSPNAPYTAQLVINPDSGTKRLVTRHLQREHFILSAFHDHVQEFFWLPTGYEILFTAAGSDRYEDGIYLWNLVKNTTTNILSEIQDEFPQLKADKLFMALSSVDPGSNRIFMFLTPQRSHELDPQQFFHTQNLYSITFKWDQSTTNRHYENYPTADKSMFDRELEPQGILVSSFEGHSAQQDWLQLTNHGPAQVVLEQWQEYCAEHAETPAFPYGLWWLASLYQDTYHLYQSQKPEKAHVLRNFGVEIAQALNDVKTAPEYLRAMGRYVRRSLLAQKTNAYQVSHLEP